MANRCCVCHTCSRKVEFNAKELPCEVLRGWLVVSHLKGVEAIDQHSFCSLSCLKRWVDSQAPAVPEVFIRSLDDEGGDQQA
ncbi:MAG: hypothetical protein V3T68_04115 [Dehalococcoidales bacterium]